ncbi:MAG TPA: hypothetical protein VGK87_04265 [Anaerolineae bacterium]|jgi:hypothetical protein
MQTASNNRLRTAIRRITRHAKDGLSASGTTLVAHTVRDSRDWQQFIEAELDQLNRRLTQIESRMTIVFYLVVILTVVTVVTDANAAQVILKSVLQIR